MQRLFALFVGITVTFATIAPVVTSPVTAQAAIAVATSGIATIGLNAIAGSFTTNAQGGTACFIHIMSQNATTNSVSWGSASSSLAARTIIGAGIDNDDIWWLHAPASGNQVVTWNRSASGMTGTIGVTCTTGEATNPIGATVTTAASTTNITTQGATITTTAANSLILGVSSQNGAHHYTAFGTNATKLYEGQNTDVQTMFALKQTTTAIGNYSSGYTLDGTNSTLDLTLLEIKPAVPATSFYPENF